MDAFSPILIVPKYGLKDARLIDASSGKVEVTNESQESIYIWVKYTYFDLESATNFKCIDSVYNTYYFDKVTCFDGTTQCSGYVNANCIFNDGAACSNTGISTRKIISYSETQTSTSPTEVRDEEHSIVSTIKGKSTIYLKKTPVNANEEIIINPQDDIVSTYKIKSVDTGEVEVTVIRAGDIKVTYFYDAKTETEVADPNLKNQQVVSEDIPFAAFWDSVACQNGTMAQRCDGYSKVLPPGTFRGTYPDWNAIKLGDFLPLTELIEIIQKFINSLLSGTEKLTDSVINFISLIQKKIEYIQGILARIQEMLELLDTIFFDAGIHLLNIPTSKGGNEYLKKSISSAQGGPSSGIDGFTGGAMLSWGSPNFADPTIKAGEALKRLFGITD